MHPKLCAVEVLAVYLNRASTCNIKNSILYIGRGYKECQSFIFVKLNTVHIHMGRGGSMAVPGDLLRILKAQVLNRVVTHVIPSQVVHLSLQKKNIWLLNQLSGIVD